MGIGRLPWCDLLRFLPTEANITNAIVSLKKILPSGVLSTCLCGHAGYIHWSFIDIPLMSRVLSSLWDTQSSAIELRNVGVVLYIITISPKFYCSFSPFSFSAPTLLWADSLMYVYGSVTGRQKNLEGNRETSPFSFTMVISSMLLQRFWQGVLNI